MNATEPIIDVTPINSSRTRVQAQDSKTAPGVGGVRGGAHSSSAYSSSMNGAGSRGGVYGGNPFGDGVFGAGSCGGVYGGSPFGNGTFVAGMHGNAAGTAYAAKSPSSMLGGLAQIVIGTGLVVMGIPMLLLPGPGLLSIAAGGFLVSRGMSKLRM